MKKAILNILLIVGLIIPLFSSSDKLILGKKYVKHTPKAMPSNTFFNKQNENYTPDRKSANYDKLLVLLVDFQEDNDSNTTGNGKFLTEIDPLYGTTIDSPPHNKLFYETHMEALKYYYRAVSYESYQLNSDVYPKNTQAYTLPHPMSYYNPGVNSSLFVSRVEEYFHDIFTLADQDTSIVFSNYGHYMVIHAGSDWQHDTKGDTPSDIPSFFIRVGTGKEVVVDNGATTIYHTCNVPETITQDINETQEGDNTFVYGYGAVNSVFAHEFGHSLGLVDLYNVRNYRSEVGSFDIMDSGGQGSATSQDPNNPNHYYAVEGVMPVLPGAWSRNILFRDLFISKGITKSLSSKYVNFDELIKIKAVETKYDNINNTPYFYEIPLSSSEYLLIENRNIDPDEDGGTSIQSALDHRVALYPSPLYSDGFIYEYDWMLPSWQTETGSWCGGGILAWHIDNNRIYEIGVTDSDGNFVSNFDNNTVNTLHTKRGIRIIEADNLPDIGNPDSWYPTGTAYEYFSKYKPNLNQNGLFVSWNTSDTLDTGELSAFTKPALLLNDGKPSSWSLNNMSIPSSVMTFKISNTLFNKTLRLVSADTLNYVSPVCNMVSDTATELMISTGTESQYYSHLFNGSSDEWSSFWNEEKIYKPSLPITKFDFKQNGLELMIIPEDSLLTITNHEISDEQLFDERIVDSPIAYNINDIVYLAIPLESKLEIYKVSYSSAGFDYTLVKSLNVTGKIAHCNNNLIIQSQNELRMYNISLDSYITYNLTGNYEKYNPLAFYDTQSLKMDLFIMSDKGQVYRLSDNKLTRIFSIKEFTNEPASQLALTLNSSNNLILHLGAGNKVFEFYPDGTLCNGFPTNLNQFSIKPFSEINVISLDNKLISIFNSDKSGLIGVNEDGSFNENYSMFWDKGNYDPIWFKEEQSNRLFVLYTDRKNNVMLSWNAINNNDQLLWNGYRNNSQTSPQGAIHPVTVTGTFNAFVCPNPIQKSEGRIRIENPKHNVSIKVYDIAGNLLINDTVLKSNQTVMDYQLDVSDFSSAVYIAIVSDKNQTRRIKFSVLK